MAMANTGVRTYLQWVPAHCGLPGNERADALAKEASSGAPAAGRPAGSENYRLTTAPSVRTWAVRPASVWSAGRRPTAPAHVLLRCPALGGKGADCWATHRTVTVSRTPAWWPTSPLATGPSRAPRLLRTELLLEGTATTGAAVAASSTGC